MRSSINFSDPEKMIAQAVAKKAERLVDEIVATIMGPVKREIDKFFVDLAAYLGHETDLASQVSVPGLASWAPLSLSYVKAKGQRNFFLATPYDSQMQKVRASAQGKANPRGRATPARTTPLIANLKMLHGSDVFGALQMFVQDFDGETIREVRGRNVIKRASTGPRRLEDLRYQIVIRPFGDLKKSDLPYIETWLLTHGLGREDAAKLINRRGKHRPVIRPLIARLADEVIPRIVYNTLRARGFKVQVKLKRSIDLGPFNNG